MHDRPFTIRPYLARLLAGTVAVTCAGVIPAAAAGAATIPSQGAPANGGSVHQTKPGVVRDGTWFLRDTPTTGAATVPSFVYGNPDDFALMGDWDGDGDDTPAVWRDGVFFLRNTNTTGPADIVVRYGNPDDFPIVGDWDGDGDDTIGVTRRGRWFLRNANSAGVADITFSYGDPDDLTLVGDWDNDGDDTAGITRLVQDPNGERFFEGLLRTTNDTGNADLPPTSVGPVGNFWPVPRVADFDLDGSEDVNSYSSATSVWTHPTGEFLFGSPEFDIPVTWG
jgi:hypothetical protein